MLLMNKSKLTLAIMGSLITSLSLAGCSSNLKWGPEGSGYILTFTNTDGSEVNVTADSIFGDYYSDVDGSKKMFDSVYEVIVRNHFTAADQQGKLTEITKSAENKVSGVKSKANSNKDTNGTTYDEEFEKLLKNYGVEDEDELKEYFIYQEEKTEFEDQFYDQYLNDDTKNEYGNLRDGFKIGDNSYAGYLTKKIPYHVKHILVKVSADSNTFYNGKISEAEARKLSNVASMLAEGGVHNFGEVAYTQSDDTTSGAAYGDLGIMDKDTSFINEFKLGLYAYDSLYNKKTVANESRISIPSDQKTFFTNDSKVGQIPYAVFEEMAKVADTDTDSNGNGVNGSDAFYYPRNIYFNKYLNNHMISVIVPNDLPTASELYSADPTTGVATGSESYVGAANATYAAKSGFKSKASEIQNINWTNNSDGKVLCDEAGRIILVVRGGSSGDSGYQGVHFITVERSALIDSETITTSSTGSYDVSLSEYYTTHYPSEEKYPTYTYNGVTYPKNTYVNIRDENQKEYKTRAETVESKIKGFEPLLDTYIYQIYAREQNIAFHGDEGTKVQNSIDSYITTQRNKNDYDSSESWTKTWSAYEEYLEQQANERTKDKLLSATCAIQYTNPDKSSLSGWTVKGGMCNYDENK